MSWPHPPDYNEAIQNPKFCFSDPELQQGQASVNALGLPWPRSGNHADVYKLECPGGQSWAIKCFTREVHGLRRRYQAISDHLRQAALPAMVEFQYQDEGIRIHGQWYPLVKMRWVDGLTLNELLREHAEKPQVLERLAQLWLRLAQEMRNARITHGDLQHGNVLLVPGATPGTLKLRLVDYDGMVVPALADAPSGEVGHPNYQHPQRLRDGTYDAEVDRFAHLVIYTTIRSVALAGRPLWERHDNGENFLFREQDFQAPDKSALFHELSELNDPEVWALVGRLVLAANGPLDRIPLLDEVVVNGTVRPLSEEEQDQVTQCLEGAASLAPVAVMAAATMVRLPATGTATLVLGPSKKTWRGPFAPPPGRLRLGKTLFDSGRQTAKRLTGWSTAAVLMVCAGLGLLTFGLLVGMVFWVGTVLFGSPSESRLPEDDPENQFTIFTTAPGLFLRPGEERILPVKIRRQGWDDPIELHVEGLPDGLTCAPSTVPPGAESALLILRAGPGSRPTVRQVEITASVEERTLARTTVPVTLLSPDRWPWKDRDPVPPTVSLTLPLSLPARLAPLPDIALRIGKRHSFRVTLLREGKEGDFSLELQGLPKGVTSRVLPVDDNPDALQVEMSAAAFVAESNGLVTVRATLGDRPLEVRTFALTLRQTDPPRPLRPDNLILKAGQTRVIRIEVDRQNHEGPIDIELHGLPAGVTSKPATVGAEEQAVAVELKVAANAPASERPVEVWAVVGGQKAGKESFQLTIRQLSAEAPSEAELPSEKVNFRSVDGVHLAGTWYPGVGRSEAPCILLLHEPGGRYNRESWERLARAFQKKGYAVFAFDFRGHGESTRIDAAFWKHATNRVLRIGDVFDEQPAESISYKNFTPAYYPMLVNDIAAARVFLDQKNDQQECNSAKLVLIGAGEGATLAAMWLYGEWHRFQLTSPDPLLLSREPEGRLVAGAAWLSVRPRLGGKFCRAGEWLKVVGSDRRVPMGFIYGSEDEPSAQFARQCLREIKPARVIQHLTSEKAIRSTGASGQALLEKLPATDTFVANYVASVLETVPHPRWSLRSTAMRTFYWRFPNGTPIPAKAKGETLLHLAPLERLQAP